jgi:serine/threonine-protein kinase
VPDVLDRLKAALADRYLIERELGAGGMATVYLAQDVKHERQVAIKVLRPELAAVLGAERFVQEIKTTANLQHPHILPLFDSGQADGFLYYVMPYIEGETLRDKLSRETQLGIEEAVKITTEVADALDYAHRQGVIHRDIKPENILLHDGRPMVADFGIALAVSAAAGGRMTETGLSLGTPHYMSPEQATAEKDLTNRSDIYSLGAVLYEMLTGDPPHTGSSAQAIIMKIVTEDARPVTIVRKSVPPNVAVAVATALEKLPADRFASAAEFAEALTHLTDLAGRPTVTAAARGTTAYWRTRSLANWQVGALIAVVTGLGIFAASHRPAAGPAIYDVGLPDTAPISFAGGSPWGEGWPALSVAPDGDFVIYTAQRGAATELWYRSLVDTVARPIVGTGGAYYPMVSPNGRSVAYFNGSSLEVVPVTGGTPTVIGEVDRPEGAEWAADGRILVADNNGKVLRWFDPSTKTSTIAARASCALPTYDRRSHGIVCGYQRRAWAIAAQGEQDTTRVPLRFAARGDSATLPVIGTHFRLLDDDLVAFVSSDGALLGAMADLPRRQLGRPVSLIRGLRREGFHAPGQYDVSSTGTLAFVPGANAEVGRFARLTPGGSPVLLPIPPGAYHRFDVSADGRRLAVVKFAADQHELWVFDITTGHGERWLQAMYIGEPRWDRRGERIIVTLRPDLNRPYVTVLGSPVGTNPPDTLRGSGRGVYVSTYFADSLVLGFAADNKLVRLDLRTRPERVDTLTADAGFAPALSPDGRWLAYSGSEVGRYDVFLERFPSDGQRYRVTPNGGLEGLWLNSSRLLFRSGSAFFEVGITVQSANPVGEPRLVARDPRFVDTMERSMVLAPDGSIIYVQGTGQATGSFIRVIPRWIDQARRLVREQKAGRSAP